jgi:hypothetical protein
MLDYIQQRNMFNRNAPIDRRRDERRCAECRGEDRRESERRGALNCVADTFAFSGERERREDDRRHVPRRENERRAFARRTSERRLDPSRVRRLSQPDGGFLTSEERDFLQSMWPQSGNE